MTHYETTVVLCRKSDRKVKTIYADESVDTVREKYVKAALGNRQFNAGKWSIDLDENLVLSIQPTMVKRARYPLGLMKLVKPVIGRKWPSSAEH
ncbi:hypothetical protein EFE22_09470 [Lactobacillus delbrueckii subsp. lactis]|uniref:hypothetical protein n=1 Tax=Lactobacillus delbrueckii TaxID=1584 RepID=UPI001E4E45C1|nr:hypothetical protein [Lactobacillus delbrueckii]MCD5439803.1 hypothetical protein [Lactobacillus delbrueckii subsp. lactis]MCD5531042.1 hypothetical protein [Lactobacillus delbrueckii subsp. lactis]MCS8615952.1 hypothetical protein [Lactobacillus delbrueckii subsp. lactis]